MFTVSETTTSADYGDCDYFYKVFKCYNIQYKRVSIPSNYIRPI